MTYILQPIRQRKMQTLQSIKTWAAASNIVNSKSYLNILPLRKSKLQRRTYTLGLFRTWPTFLNTFMLKQMCTVGHERLRTALCVIRFSLNFAVIPPAPFYLSYFNIPNFFLGKSVNLYFEHRRFRVQSLGKNNETDCSEISTEFWKFSVSRGNGGETEYKCTKDLMYLKLRHKLLF